MKSVFSRRRSQTRHESSTDLHSADAETVTDRPHRPRGPRLYLLAGGLLVLAVIGLWHQDGFRSIEASVVSRVLSSFTGIRASEFSHQPIIWLHSHEPGTFGLKITAECTSALIVSGFLLLTVILALSGRFGSKRLLMALGGAAVVAFVINVVRLGIIAVAASEWGLQTGFTTSHVYVGSVVTILGTAAALAAYLWVLSRGTKSTGSESPNVT